MPFLTRYKLGTWLLGYTQCPEYVWEAEAGAYMVKPAYMYLLVTYEGYICMFDVGLAFVN